VQVSHQRVVITYPLCTAILLGCVLAVIAGQPPLAQQLSSAPNQPVEQHKSHGAVRLRLTTDRPSMGLAETLRLMLTVEAPAELDLILPEVPPSLGPFEVVQHRTTGPLRIAPQTQQWQREYGLAVTTAGSLTVPALTVQVATGDTTAQLTTDPFTITVTTLVPADADPSSMKDIAPPVPLIRRSLPPWGWIVAAGILGLGLLASGWWWYRRWRRPSRPDACELQNHWLRRGS